ncbi:MAG: ABC transporter ATP-binding protein [Sphingobium sp.]
MNLSSARTAPAEAATLSAAGIMLDIGGRRLLHDVDVAIKARERVAIIGPNGSGKSTLLRCLHAWLVPVEGTILLDGRDLSTIGARARARTIAVMTQDAEAGLGMTVRDVVVLGRIAHRGVRGDDGQGNGAEVEAIMRRVRIAGLADRSFASLSGGERQRVMFARALAQRPCLLLLDEPTNHLDIGYQFDLMNVARDTGCSVIATLHDINLAARWADRIYLMQDGRIARSGLPGEVLDPDLIGRVYGVDVERDVDPRSGAIRLSFYPRGAEEAL